MLTSQLARRSLRRLVPVVALLATTLATASRADDRDLLRASLGEPYLFIVLDTSGSMHWSPPCSQEQFDAGECAMVCPNGDCYTALNGDDRASKLYQAKEALYEVLRATDGVHYGFATYNQDNLRMIGKNWLYRLRSDEHGIQLVSGTRYPANEAQQVFGHIFNCASGGDTTGFAGDAPADLNDEWEVARTYRCSQLGQDGNQASNNGRYVYIRDPADGRKYRVSYSPHSGEDLGDTDFRVDVTVVRCTNSSCSSFVTVDTETLRYRLISDFNMWDNIVERGQRQRGFFSQGQASDSPADNTCSGWDPNTDSNSDRDSSSFYNIRYPTVVDPNSAYRPYLDKGDVVALDWRTSNKDAILRILAPNTALGESVPDFRSARYFQDSLTSGVLRLRDGAARPVIAYGSTPLGKTLANFRTWFQGFRNIAGTNDPDWACRKKYLLVLTDGDQSSCDGTDSCTVARQLKDSENVRTYVVGFGLQRTDLNPGNKLDCMASNGGTGEPILPQNKQQLVEALTDILGDIKEEARAFASAAVPSVQAEADDKIFFSTFTPLNNASVWDGHLDAYIKPLPLLNNVPNRDRACTSLGPDEQFACHLWDAGAVLVSQAPTASEVASNNLRLGNAEDQRRVFFPFPVNPATEAVPVGRALFTPPSDAMERNYLWGGLGLDYTSADLTSSGSDAELAAISVIKQTLVQKEATIDTGTDTVDITYVLGDIFHANPIFVDRPNDFRAFAGNYGSDGSDANGNNCADNTKAYRCFAQKHQRRRKVLTVGSNDGLQHFFDAGIYDATDEKFDNGTGKEIMAVIPRLAMPVVRFLAGSHTQSFAVDGSLRVLDVMIDPVHSLSDPVDPDEREWRTIGIAGLREGGLRNTKPATRVTLDNGRPFSSGYFALDLTQPDKLNADNEPINRDVVPSCLSNYEASACGPVQYGAELWEFTDSYYASPAEGGVPFDEDINGSGTQVGNGEADLGDTWSTPIVGQIRVLNDSNAPELRWVAIFGGGFDPLNPANPQRGNFLYMVDIETGKALYKQSVEGAIPSNVAAVDRTGDGVLDRIYFGTTAGYMYKVDLSVPVGFTDVSARDLGGATHTVSRITDVAWRPFKIFDDLHNGHRQPIFFPPTALVVAEIDRVALAFGVGNRADLWELDNVDGRFYLLVDDNYARTDTGLPKDEGDYTLIDSRAAAASSGANFLLAPSAGNQRGWIMTLDSNERLVGQAFSVSGVTIFSTFNPQLLSSTDEDGEPVCARTGDSRLFTVFTTNANSIQGASFGRWHDVGEALVTPPYADRSTPKSGNSETPTEPAECNTPEREAAIQALKDTFPRGTKFANYTVNVNFIRSDTELVCAIPIPVGIVEKNWKEF